MYLGMVVSIDWPGTVLGLAPLVASPIAFNTLQLKAQYQRLGTHPFLVHVSLMVSSRQSKARPFVRRTRRPQTAGEPGHWPEMRSLRHQRPNTAVPPARPLRLCAGAAAAVQATAGHPPTDRLQGSVRPSRAAGFCLSAVRRSAPALLWSGECSPSLLFWLSGTE